jgi:hypothetical protein
MTSHTKSMNMSGSVGRSSEQKNTTDHYHRHHHYHYHYNQDQEESEVVSGRKEEECDVDEKKKEEKDEKLVDAERKEAEKLNNLEKEFKEWLEVGCRYMSYIDQAWYDMWKVDFYRLRYVLETH